MSTTQRRDSSFWVIQIPGWMLLIYLIIAQGLTAFSYELGVAMGTQESAATITEVGTTFWYGFAFGDLVAYIPLLLAGLIGHWRGVRWGREVLAAALGITLYWPIVCLAALVDARDAAGWNLADEVPYWIVCVTVAAYGAAGLWVLLRSKNKEIVT